MTEHGIFLPNSAHTCPHRRTRQAGDSGSVVHCQLVDKIVDDGETGSEDELEASVCEACCRWFEPSIDDWNPVVSSLVLNRIGRVPDRANTAQLREKATASIPIMQSEPADYSPQECTS